MYYHHGYVHDRFHLFVHVEVVVDMHYYAAVGNYIDCDDIDSDDIDVLHMVGAVVRHSNDYTDVAADDDYIDSNDDDDDDFDDDDDD